MKNATTATTTSAMLRAVAYLDAVREAPSAGRSAAIEKPRLTNALTAVIAAQIQ